VRAAVVDPRLELHHLPSDEPSPPRSFFKRTQRRWDARAETDRTMFGRYIDFPATLGRSCDAVLWMDGPAASA